MERAGRLDALPMIDFAPFLAGPNKAITAEVGHACETIGFFYLKNHDIDARAVSRPNDAAGEPFVTEGGCG